MCPPHVDCKFLLGIVCSYTDLKSVHFSPSLNPFFLCALFMSPLLPVSVHLLLHCWLMVFQLLLCSHDLALMWGNIKGSIFIYFSSTSLMCHDCEIWKFFCSYRMTFVYAIATWKHRNNAGWTIFPHLLISASKFSCRHIHLSFDLSHIIIGFLILSQHPAVCHTASFLFLFPFFSWGSCRLLQIGHKNKK